MRSCCGTQPRSCLWIKQLVWWNNASHREPCSTCTYSTHLLLGHLIGHWPMTPLLHHLTLLFCSFLLKWRFYSFIQTLLKPPVSNYALGTVNEINIRNNSFYGFATFQRYFLWRDNLQTWLPQGALQDPMTSIGLLYAYPFYIYSIRRFQKN